MSAYLLGYKAPPSTGYIQGMHIDSAKELLLLLLFDYVRRLDEDHVQYYYLLSELVHEGDS
jgi:hypothetical protein